MTNSSIQFTVEPNCIATNKSQDYTPPRCPKCGWALYDGTWCQNPNCEDWGKDVNNPSGLNMREFFEQKEDEE